MVHLTQNLCLVLHLCHLSAVPIFVGEQWSDHQITQHGKRKSELFDCGKDVKNMKQIWMVRLVVVSAVGKESIIGCKK